MLEIGRYATIDELAAAEKINASYVSRILQLTLRAPDIVSAILDGQHWGSLSLAELAGPTAVGWDEQRAAIGLAELNGRCADRPKAARYRRAATY